MPSCCVLLVGALLEGCALSQHCGQIVLQVYAIGLSCLI
jgi:hypothetical protein